MERWVGDRGEGGEAPEKAGLHPRNRHRDRYDFRALTKASPELGPFVRMALHGGLSIDFTDPDAVRALNRAILFQVYRVEGWDIPHGYLCPPIPARADYLHHAADLLAELTGGKVPKGRSIGILDIGTGANLIYPLIGHREYGWRFVGTDIDKLALDAARKIIRANAGFEDIIELRLQRDRGAVFKDIVKPGETFDLCLCNPPFHVSREEALAGTERKWRNLGKGEGDSAPTRNFGGHGSELWCAGGEVAFVRRMIEESAAHPTLCRWFTTLISKSSNLPAIHRALRHVEARDIRTIEMTHGQKKSRIVAWTFRNETTQVKPHGRSAKK